MKSLFYSLLLLLLCNSGKGQTIAKKSQPPRQYSIGQFYKNIKFLGGSLSTDDKKILLTSNESGIYNSYEIDLATGERKPLTTSAKESIFSSSYVPGTNDVIYSSDKGGNEN